VKGSTVHFSKKAEMVTYSPAKSASSSLNRLGNATVPPYNPDLAANDFGLYRVLKESVVGQNFEHHE
jgi:hypothetical protein